LKEGIYKKNAAIIQKLIDVAKGGLLVLAEYALTGSLIRWKKEQHKVN